MKSYYSCIDNGFVRFAPQPLQHLAIADKAKKLDGRIVFYTAEDPQSLETHGVIRSKLKEQEKDIDGVIFFTIRQFFYGREFKYKILKTIHGQMKEVHFVRENISIFNQNDLDELFPLLYANQFVLERDGNGQFCNWVWEHIASRKKTSPTERVLVGQI